MLTYERMKEMEARYRTGAQAAETIRLACFYAETAEICANFFDETPKARELHYLERKFAELQARYNGAKQALHELRREMPEEELPALDREMQSVWFRLAVKHFDLCMKQLEDETAAVSA